MREHFRCNLYFQNVWPVLVAHSSSCFDCPYRSLKWSEVESTWMPSSKHWKPVCAEMRSYKTNWRKAGSMERNFQNIAWLFRIWTYFQIESHFHVFFPCDSGTRTQSVNFQASTNMTSSHVCKEKEALQVSSSLLSVVQKRFKLDSSKL